MKAILCLLALFMKALAVMQIHIPTTLPSYPHDSSCSSPPSPPSSTPPAKYRYYCNGHRNKACQRYSAPTCGWYNQNKVHCDTFPCAAQFSNPCVACNNKYVKYVTCEKCPPSNISVTQINYKDAGTNQLPTCN